MQHENPSMTIPETLKDQRRKARALALQALYELDGTTHRLGDVLSERLQEENLDPEAHPFIETLVTGVRSNADRLDDALNRFMPERPVSQLSTVDRSIMRMALYEFGIWKETPHGVVINEAVELAKRYGADSSARLVNAVLSTLVDRITEVQPALEGNG